MENEFTNAFLLTLLLDPKVKTREGQKRIKPSLAHFKVLNAIYQLNKNLSRKNKPWQEVACGKQLIADVARVSRTTVTEFITSSEFYLFCQKKERFKATNIYRLEKWVVRLFRFFELKGMMKGIMTDFKKWKTYFLKRCRNWLFPLLEKGFALHQIVMNKLSTKKPLKVADQKPLKVAGIKPSREHEAFHESRSNTEIPSLADFNQLGDHLIRFGCKNGDVNFFLKTFSLNHHKKAVMVLDLWRKRGMSIESPAKVYQTCLNRTRRVA